MSFTHILNSKKIRFSAAFALFLVFIIYFIFLENDLFFSLKDGSSIIVSSSFTKSLFYYPSYNFFELYPCYNAYLSSLQADYSLASPLTYEDWAPEELPSSPLLFPEVYRAQFFSFLKSYRRLAPLFFFSEIFFIHCLIFYRLFDFFSFFLSYFFSYRIYLR